MPASGCSSLATHSTGGCHRTARWATSATSPRRSFSWCRLQLVSRRNHLLFICVPLRAAGGMSVSPIKSAFPIAGMDIVYIVPDLEVQPPHCRPVGELDPLTRLPDPYGSCGSSLAFPFIASYFVLCEFLLLNMIIAIIMEQFEASKSTDDLEVQPADLQHYRNTWHGHVTLRGQKSLKLDELGAFLEDLGEPLGSPIVPVPPRWLNLARHQVEDMWPLTEDSSGKEDDGHSIKFEQLLMTLSMMTLSTECLSYEELYHMRNRAPLPRSLPHQRRGSPPRSAPRHYRPLHHLCRDQWKAGHFVRSAQVGAAAAAGSKRDRSAKILISSIRAWGLKRNPPPDVTDKETYVEMVHSCKTFRMNYICKCTAWHISQVAAAKSAPPTSFAQKFRLSRVLLCSPSRGPCRRTHCQHEHSGKASDHKRH
eukprot:SAG11_NODE_535_length_8688_cov_2.395809_1_plen_423_part_00